MSSSNPSFTASAIVTDIESRLRNPNLSTSLYLPWISTAFNRVYQKLSEVGQHAKQEYFGARVEVSLNTSTPSEVSLEDEIPRFGGLIGVQIKYGATGDVYQTATKLRSMNQWSNWANVSTTYRDKTNPLYYIFGDTFGVIPVPPEAAATARIHYIKRAFQVTDGTDVLDIPYRFMYPIFTYVQARAIERVSEDYQVAAGLDRRFEAELEQIALAAASEFNEDGYELAIEVDGDSPIYSDPFNN